MRAAAERVVPAAETGLSVTFSRPGQEGASSGSNVGASKAGGLTAARTSE